MREDASSIGSATIAESDETVNQDVDLVAESLENGAAATGDDRAYDSGGGDGGSGDGGSGDDDGDGGDDDDEGRDEQDKDEHDDGDVVLLVVPQSFDGRLFP